MEETRLRTLKPEERGAALVLVLMALATVLPLVLVLSELVLMRQRQVNVYRENLGGQAGVRGGLALAMARLQPTSRVAGAERSAQIVLSVGQATRFSLDDPGTRPVRVLVSREPDAVLTLEGRVLRPEDVGLDLRRVGIDGEGRVQRQYRLLEVYLVEAEAPARYPFPAVRLLGVVARVEDEAVVCLGLRYDRGHFP